MSIVEDLLPYSFNRWRHVALANKDQRSFVDYVRLMMPRVPVFVKKYRKNTGLYLFRSLRYEARTKKGRYGHIRLSSTSETKRLPM